MDHEAGGLVHDHQVVVGKDDPSGKLPNIRRDSRSRAGSCSDEPGSWCAGLIGRWHVHLQELPLT
jgi:hypothetical protein